jgi:putative glycosyltransferase (TIGR04372 family)
VKVFLNRQIIHIRKRGFKEIFVKLFIITKIAISKFSLFIFTPFLIIIILLKPFILIRFGILNAKRIGHFTGNFDLYYFRRQSEKLYLKKNILDIISYNNPISNNFFFNKIKKIIHLHSYVYVKPLNDLILLLSSKFSFFKIFLVPSFAPTVFPFADHDTQNILFKKKKLIKFSAQEQKLGSELLERLGVNNNKFICLILRDKKYLEEKFNREDWSYHDYRNIDIDDCNDMLKELSDLGYFIIRMGRNVEKKISLNKKEIIDYSNSEYVSDFADFFLFSKCEFCISSGTGPDMIARMFRKMVARFMVPIGYFHTSSLDVNAFFPHYSSRLKRNLNLQEIYDHGLFMALESSIFQSKQVKLIKNDKKFYKDFGKFCTQIYEKKIKYNNIKNNKNLFWKKFKKYHKNKKKINAIFFDYEKQF